MAASMVKRVVVAGSGTMGVSLAQIFAGHGFEVTLWNHGQPGLERAAAQLQPGAVQRVRLSTDEGVFSEAQFVIESIVENMEVKQDFLRRVSALAPDCLLTTNTSGLSISRLAEAVQKPERFAGMHWINPPTLIPLVEVVKGQLTSLETMDAVFNLALALGKRPIRTKDVPGFLLNRLQFAVIREALSLVEGGTAGIEDIDNAIKYGLGIRYACLGPFETADLGGLDVFDKISSYLFGDLDNRDQAPMLDSLCARGCLGVKSGRGFYDYNGDRAALAVARRDEKLVAVVEALSRIEHGKN